ncbi:MAG: ribbon-helix-helix protein, CopG family [Candidatus Bathyarchaeota archaeon]|jgi:Arc/MetJ-type ribon-helix-helix transcriptional regulator|nr:MAG: ribbon-helix-helix protein, CopG family [Candidatus Bathyarchaeota archaeon]
MVKRMSKPITLVLPTTYIKDLDELVRRKYYSSRSEAIRNAIRDLLNDELWLNKD